MHEFKASGAEKIVKGGKQEVNEMASGGFYNSQSLDLG